MPSMVILIENISEEQMTEMAIMSNGLKPTPQKPWKFWIYQSASLNNCIPEACVKALKEDEG